MRLSRRPRVAWLLSVVVLVAALAFAACGPRAHQSGGNFNGYGGTTSGQNTGQGTTTGTTSQTPNEQAVQSTDQAIQSAMQSLQSSQNDANTDYSSQDNPVVP